MSITQVRRIPPAVLQADREALVALGAMTDYDPSNEALSLASVTAALAEMQAAQEAELLAEAARDAARDAAAAAELCFHEAILGVKDQVISQYGVNSDQVHSLGLKKKCEYKRPSRSAPEPEPDPTPAP